MVVALKIVTLGVFMEALAAFRGGVWDVKGEAFGAFLGGTWGVFERHLGV